MKKQLLKSALIAVAGIGLLAGSAMATTILTNNLQNQIDAITINPIHDSSINAATDYLTNDSYWALTATGISATVLVFEIAGNDSINSFGIYDKADESNYVEIFSGADVASAKKVVSITDTNLIEINLVLRVNFLLVMPLVII